MESTATEADTCRKFVVPQLLAAGWDSDPHSIAEQRRITDGRIVPMGRGFIRKTPKRVDYLLRYTRDFPLAAVAAKAAYKAAADGVQQAKLYAGMPGLKFAYATNGREIIEIDYATGIERQVEGYPTPAELWARYQRAGGRNDQSAGRLLAPAHYGVGKSGRYYQQIAINRAVEAIVTGARRLLITMATGTGKTVVAFQICWKLWSARWNRTGQYRRPKILYPADRNILVDQPKDGISAAFGDARIKIEAGEVVKSREMYFAIYQALAENERRLGIFKEFAPDFFDLIIVDECHRGSARDDSAWRAILQYFEPATQLGMTATPLREETRDTYRYFGDPIYQYSLRQGIEDGFLFPDDRQTGETALLFLQLIMRRLKRGGRGRAGVVVPHGTLFGDGVAARIKVDLLTEFNLHTIVRLPEGVFAPYTDIPTNVIFFDTTGPTGDIWDWEQPLPGGRRKYSKTAPL